MEKHGREGVTMTRNCQQKVFRFFSPIRWLYGCGICMIVDCHYLVLTLPRGVSDSVNNVVFFCENETVHRKRIKISLQVFDFYTFVSFRKMTELVQKLRDSRKDEEKERGHMNI